MPCHLLPSLRQAIAEDRPHALLTLAVAAWFCYLRGVDLTGRELAIEDVHRDRLQALVLAGTCDPRPWLAERCIFGDLGSDPTFVADLGQAIEQLERDGVRSTIQAHLATPALLAR
jgi:fructuronate reductase/mannitol 2-dehydrogenase